MKGEMSLKPRTQEHHHNSTRIPGVQGQYGSRNAVISGSKSSGVTLVPFVTCLLWDHFLTALVVGGEYQLPTPCYCLPTVKWNFRISQNL